MGMSFTSLSVKLNYTVEKLLYDGMWRFEGKTHGYSQHQTDKSCCSGWTGISQVWQNGQQGASAQERHGWMDGGTKG